MHKLMSLFLLVSFLHSFAQGQSPSAASLRTTSSQRKELASKSLLGAVETANIGPTIFNGRVADIDVNPEDPTEFFVAYASGGLWYTQNNGTTFTPLFQQESVMTIGDIAVDWNTGIVYLGSGEQNSSRSSYAGNGVYKSADKGKTWKHLGLDETHHISRVIIHPSNPDKLWVAALGHLYSNNAERGIFMSTDGGNSWTTPLMVNDSTGASDIVIHPENPDVLYAATWERSRRAWHFQGAGAASAIYKSTDGGISWQAISGPESGFVNGKGTGRIGLALTVKERQEYLFAIVDNNHHRPEVGRKTNPNELTVEQLKVMDAASFSKLDPKKLKVFMENNSFPKKYKVEDLFQLVKNGKITPAQIATYNNDANSNLMNTPVIGAEVYLTSNQGKNWTKTHASYLDDVYFSYGYYFGQIRVQPGNPDKLYIFGVPILTSNDGGKSWSSIDGDNVHSDHHALWLNPKRPGHLINGNDGGVNISYDDGKSWMKCTHPEVGQFYSINVDNAEPYNVYGGTQDNGVWMGSHQYTNSTSWQSSGDYPYKSIMGGDGMQVQIDNRDNTTIYTGFQFGNYFRINKAKRDRAMITPRHDVGQPPYRWNWMTPILLSAHNQDILYMGSQKVLRSMNQGKEFTEISPDLTQGVREGNVPFGTITTIDESKLRFGLIYAGTDDGLVHVTRDGGTSWQRISDNLPAGLWVSRVQASAFDESTVYVTLNGYRNDIFLPYVYRSDDYGATWASIAAGLPNEPVNVLKEDPADRDILYVGTDHGLWVSLDRGVTYHSFSDELPRTPVHDLVIQKQARHLIVGTHGRSMYKMKIGNLPVLKKKLTEELLVFSTEEFRYRQEWGKIRNGFTPAVKGEGSLEAFSTQPAEGRLEILLENGTVVSSETVLLKRGLATYTFSFAVSRDKVSEFAKWFATSEWAKTGNTYSTADDGLVYITPGKYTVQLTQGKHTVKTSFVVTDK
ncbi:MAG: glycosyl hydrolase [Saprospiraceae bacterium]|nr:glycosyl hydrolase [Saprospiraceae bacterium]